MGIADRIIRLVVAAVFATLYFTNTISGIIGLVLVMLGVVFVLTSFISLCPLCLPFGFMTNKKKKG